MSQGAIDSKLTAELVSLRDVEGVIGSFVLSDGGAVLSRDLPHLFDTETLRSVGVRIQRLLESLDPGEADTRLTLRYAEHKLYLQRAEPAIIGVISGPGASSPAMTMALTLVGRRVRQALSEAREQPSDSVAPSPPSPPPPTLPAVPRPVPPLTTKEPLAPSSAQPQPPTQSHSPTQYSLTRGHAPEAHPAASPTAPARPRYFRGRRLE